jgi:hypothetical protein
MSALWNPFPIPASTLEHPANPGKQIAKTMKSNRRQEFILIDGAFFMYLGTAKTIARIIQSYDGLSYLLMDASLHRSQILRDLGAMQAHFVFRSAIASVNHMTSPKKSAARFS